MKHQHIVIYTLISFIILLCTSHAVTVTGAEPEPTSTSVEELGLDVERYYDMGYQVAKEDFSGLRPAATGVLTGMTLPIVTIGAVAVTHEIHEVVSVFAGAGTFSFWLWGGNLLSQKRYEPSQTRHLNAISEKERQSFVRGYRQCIDDRQKSNYIFGVIAGIGLDLYILSRLFADFHGFGGT